MAFSATIQNTNSPYIILSINTADHILNTMFGTTSLAIVALDDIKCHFTTCFGVKVTLFYVFKLFSILVYAFISLAGKQSTSSIM